MFSRQMQFVSNRNNVSIVILSWLSFFTFTFNFVFFSFNPHRSPTLSAIQLRAGHYVGS